MHFWIPGQSLLVISSDAVADELLNKRGAKYSSRPRLPLYEMYDLHITSPFSISHTNSTLAVRGGPISLAYSHMESC
jgi:hypothetical protein